MRTTLALLVATALPFPSFAQTGVAGPAGATGRTDVTARVDLTAHVETTAQVDVTAQVDLIFKAWNSDQMPGCAVGVAQNGRTLLERAYGMADLEWGIPNTPETIFEGGSLSKQFTAAAVILLALDGKLSLTDDIRKYVPEVPDYGSTITLRHLLTHTSGLRDWGSVAQISGWGREERTHDHADVLDIVSRQTALNFEPGFQYSYSNTGFNLLAVVVDRVAGIPFADFSKERVFTPLGLMYTQWRDDYRRIVPGRSTAYNVLGGGRIEINRPIELVHGNGGILTTVGDLLLWNQSLSDRRFGDDFVRMMEDTGVLNDGKRITYASGLVVSERDGVRVISHTGSTAGYRAFTARYPDQRLAVAMLCNASNAPTGANGNAVADVFLGDALQRTTTAAASGVQDRAGAQPTGSARALERFVGLYMEPVTGETVDISSTDGILRAGRQRLTSVSMNTFQAGARSYTFVGSASGRPQIRVEDRDYVALEYLPVEPVRPERTALSEYVGTYHSDEAETTYVIQLEGDALVLRRHPDQVATLAPIYADGFRMGFGSIIRFRRDDSGRVTHLSLSVDRVFDMRFDRAR